MKQKKSSITIEEIGKMLIALIVLVFILIVVWLFRDKMIELILKLRNIMRFGG